jgi:hypothetical protein
MNSATYSETVAKLSRQFRQRVRDVETKAHDALVTAMLAGADDPHRYACRVMFRAASAEWRERVAPVIYADPCTLPETAAPPPGCDLEAFAALPEVASAMTLCASRAREKRSARWRAKCRVLRLAESYFSA